MATPDIYKRFTTTFPARLMVAAKARAKRLGLALAPYLAQLVRADLEAAGIEPPSPPPPRRNGPKPRIG